MKSKLKSLFYNSLDKIGLVKKSNMLEKDSYISKLKQQLKDEKAEKHKLFLQSHKLKSIAIEKYPQDRDYLRKYVGEEIALSGVFVRQDKRGILLKFVNHQNSNVTDHMWFKIKGKGLSRGDVVNVKGTVEKYGSMSYQKSISENYCLDGAEIVTT